MNRISNPAELFDLGNRLFASGDAPAAADAYQRCLRIVPQHAASWFNLANAHVSAGRLVDAVSSFLACLRIDPTFGPACLNLATTLRRLTLLDHALSMGQRAIRHLPDDPRAMLCLAAIHSDRSEYEQAAIFYRRALQHVPDHAGALSSLGNTLATMGDLEAALALHDRAVSLTPLDADHHFNRAATRLLAGDFRGGWEDYEWRTRRSHSRRRDLGPIWNGEDVAGRTILLHAEQGLGDTLQFVRYAKLVADRGATVLLEVQQPLARLIRSMPGISEVVVRGTALPAFDLHCPLLSLPRILETRVETIPAAIPYLHPDPQAIAVWRARLPDGVRVGLVWAGSPHTDDAGAHLIDKRRSVPSWALAPLASVPAIHWISLQKDRPDGAIPPDLTLIDMMAEVRDFADTAALVAALDLVVSVDTSVAHLAGALGCPVRLLSRFDGCWRWLMNRNDSPWYPGMQIYRQERPLDWTSVITRLAADLVAWRSAQPHQAVGLQRAD